MRAFSLAVGLLLCTVCLPAHGRAGEEGVAPRHTQDNDLQARLSWAVEKKLSRRFSMAVSEELRTRADATRLDRLYTDVNAALRVTSFLKVHAAYTLITVHRSGKKSDGSPWQVRHRATAGVALSHEVLPRLELSLKERVQLTRYAREHFDRREKRNPQWGIKSKFQAEYKCRRAPFSPFAFVELCHTLNAPELAGGNYLDKVRSGVGTVFRINRHNSLNFLYRFDYGLEKKVKVKKSTGELKSLTHQKSYNNVLGVAYKFRF